MILKVLGAADVVGVRVADERVLVIDVVAKKEITKIKVGQIPKRNSTGIFPVIGTGTGTN